MKPRVFYMLDEDDDEVLPEIRIFYAEHFVCISGGFGSGYEVHPYRWKREKVIRNHDDWTELDLESCSLPDLT